MHAHNKVHAGYVTVDFAHAAGMFKAYAKKCWRATALEVCAIVRHLPGTILHWHILGGCIYYQDYGCYTQYLQLHHYWFAHLYVVLSQSCVHGGGIQGVVLQL